MGRGKRILTVGLLLVSGCGSVVFVDPDATLKAELVIRDVDRLIIDGDPRSYFHVRIGGRDGLDLIQLSATGPQGSLALPLEGAHQQKCGRGQTCLSITLGPGVPANLEALVLDAPSIGHRHTRALDIRMLPRYQLSGVPLSRNEHISVQVTDPIRVAYADLEIVDDVATVQLFPRVLEAVTKPGSCGTPVEVDDAGWAAFKTLPAELETTFSDSEDPTVCVAIRPKLPEGGGEVASRTIAAGAVVTTFFHTYAPPTEISPLVFMPIFNLELPSEERCIEAQTLVASAVREAAVEIAADISRGAETLELNGLQLADKNGVACRQQDDPRLDPDVVGGSIQAAIRDAFGPDRRVRVVFVYVTNLQIPMPSNLQIDLADLRGYFLDGQTLRDFVLAVAPEQAIRDFAPDEMIPWVATEEPSFRLAIRSILATSWPFKTAIHSPSTVVPLVGADDSARFQYYRICGSSPSFAAPLGEPVPGANAIVPISTGPAYRIDLPDRTLEPVQRFSSPTVEVQWAGCEALCDREPPGGTQGVPWLLTGGC